MGKVRTAREVYGDIIDLPHHQSESRIHMSLHDRAAQFAPFAALSGHAEMVREEARRTDSERILSESEIEILNQKLTVISDALMDGEHPYITLTYFRPDDRKAGGSYESVSGYVEKIDTIARKVIITITGDPDDRKMKIDINRISGLSGALMDNIEEEEP